MSDPRVEALRSTGLCIVEPFTLTEIAEINAYLFAQPVFYDAHVPQTSRNRGEFDPIQRDDPRAVASECVCVHNDHVLLAPHLLERALSYTDVAAAYLECDPPWLYSANCFWSRPGAAPLRDDIQEFHKDYDDKKFVALFVFLTDVLRDADGPHDLFGPDGEERTVRGPAGTVFLADTSRMHRGRKPTTHERGFCWYRWGVTEHPGDDHAYVWDHLAPIDKALLGDRYPVDPRLQDSIKLLAR
jgi:hypothetical protein